MVSYAANGAFVLGSADELPADAQPGTVYFDTATGAIQYYDGNNYVDVAKNNNICYVDAPDNCGFATPDDVDEVDFQAGSGINIDGTSIINTGDLDPTDDLTTATVFAGDILGTFDNLQIGPSVVGSAEVQDGAIANVDLANSALTVTAGNGLAGGGVVSLGDTVTLTLANCAINQILEFDGSNWICDFDDSGFSDFVITDGVTSQSIANNETVTFVDGTAIDVCSYSNRYDHYKQYW